MLLDHLVALDLFNPLPKWIVEPDCDVQDQRGARHEPRSLARLTQI
ncbi:hypothetical protein [Rhodococcus rhodochrous]|nr:hypothetical protein [Rhodococcus rhodochrous]